MLTHSAPCVHKSHSQRAYMYTFSIISDTHVVLDHGKSDHTQNTRVSVQIWYTAIKTSHVLWIFCCQIFYMCIIFDSHGPIHRDRAVGLKFDIIAWPRATNIPEGSSELNVLISGHKLISGKFLKMQNALSWKIVNKLKHVIIASCGI